MVHSRGQRSLCINIRCALYIVHCTLYIIFIFGHMVVENVLDNRSHLVRSRLHCMECGVAVRGECVSTNSINPIKGFKMCNATFTISLRCVPSQSGLFMDGAIISHSFGLNGLRGWSPMHNCGVVLLAVRP